MDINGCNTGVETDNTASTPSSNTPTPNTTTNNNNINSTPKTNHSKLKIIKSLDWDDYLKFCNGKPAPPECFNHNSEPPTNEFHLGEKLEVTSPDNRDFVHLATVVGCMGPRLQLRLDGCDNSNDFFELVDSEAINPIGTCKLKNRYFAAPMRFRKDAASYASFCKQVLKNAVHAPETAFKTPPKRPVKNLFQPGMKLEAVDLKHSRNICPATVKNVENHLVEIHLDGWESTNDFKCSYLSRNLFPIGWCKRTGHLLQYPGPKAEYKEKTKMQDSIISTPGTTSETCPLNDNEEMAITTIVNSSHVNEKNKVNDNELDPKSTKSTNSNQDDDEKKLPKAGIGIKNEYPPDGSMKTTNLVQSQNNSNGNPVKKTITTPVENSNSESKNVNHHVVVESSTSTSFKTDASTGTRNISTVRKSVVGNKRPNNQPQKSQKNDFNRPPNAKTKKVTVDTGTVPFVNGKNSSSLLLEQFRSVLPSKRLVDSWSVDELIEFLNLRFPEFTKFEHQFRSQEIDGRAFLMLTNDLIMKFLNIKLGYSLKIIDLIERINNAGETNC